MVDRPRNSLYRVFFRIHPNRDKTWCYELPLGPNTRFRRDVPELSIRKNDAIICFEGHKLWNTSMLRLRELIAKKRDGSDGKEGDDVFIDILSDPAAEFLDEIVRTKKVRTFYSVFLNIQKKKFGGANYILCKQEFEMLLFF